MRGRGRRRAGEDNVRLRQRIANLTDDLAWYRRRLMDVTARCRAFKAQAEIADGQRVLAEQLIQRQVMQLMERDAENEQLRRQLKAASDDTVEVPTVTDAELAAA
ncbi:MAG: hypothetical protein HOZ81_04915 [Streptomyces sp.]|nr:hypothetical protein [Streptomyces sp.]